MFNTPSPSFRFLLVQSIKPMLSVLSFRECVNISTIHHDILFTFVSIKVTTISIWLFYRISSTIRSNTNTTHRVDNATTNTQMNSSYFNDYCGKWTSIAWDSSTIECLTSNYPWYLFVRLHHWRHLYSITLRTFFWFILRLQPSEGCPSHTTFHLSCYFQRLEILKQLWSNNLFIKKINSCSEFWSQTFCKAIKYNPKDVAFPVSDQ